MNFLTTLAIFSTPIFRKLGCVLEKDFESSALDMSLSLKFALSMEMSICFIMLIFTVYCVGTVYIATLICL